MASTLSAVPAGAVKDILSRIQISQVYRALTGREARRVGAEKTRGVATWRDGSGLNVSMDDARGVWHDFVTGDGGGVLDLVVLIRGGSRHDALRWLRDFTGCGFDRPLSLPERKRWVRRRRQIEFELPRAALWRRGAIGLGEQLLDQLKAALWDAKLPRPDPGEIAYWTAQLRAWRRLQGEALVTEYQQWVRNDPHFTSGLIHVAILRETAEVRAIDAYLRLICTTEG